MSRITFNSTVFSQNAERNLAKHTSALKNTSERLSSGLRITRASDDAAGLQIAAALRADRRVFSQGMRNLNDGLSLVAVADETMNQLSTIVVRLRELASQGANGVLGAAQRASLNAETQELAKEYNRLVESASFNGKALFDGFGSLGLQGGYGVDGRISSTLGGVKGTGTFANAVNYSVPVIQIEHIVDEDLNGDGIVDLALGTNTTYTILLGNGDGTFGVARTYGLPAAMSLSGGDINNDGKMDLYGGGSNFLVLLGNGDGTFKIGVNTTFPNLAYDTEAADFNNDGKLDVMHTLSNDDQIVIRLGNGDGTFKAPATYISGDAPYYATIEDINYDGNADILTNNIGGDSVTIFFGNGDGSFRQAVTYSRLTTDFYDTRIVDVNNDGYFDLVSAMYNQNVVGVMLGNADGSFNAAILNSNIDAPTSVSMGDFNGDGKLDILSDNHNTAAVNVYLGNGNGTFKAKTSYATTAVTRSTEVNDFNRDGVDDLLATTNDGNLAIFIGNTTPGIELLAPLSMRTQDQALELMTELEALAARLTVNRGVVGAFSSRIESAVRNLAATELNVADAESRISDADIAQEAAELVKNRILQNFSTSILAQANQIPEIALGLLSG